MTDFITRFAPSPTGFLQLGHPFSLAPGIGVCGKAGQGAPVGVGKPMIKIDRLTISGAAG